MTYTFSAEALSLYDEFDSKICCFLNSRWSMGVLIKDDTELGNDRRQVIRLAIILYVLYTYTRRALFQSYSTISLVVGKTYMEYAINLIISLIRYMYLDFHLVIVIVEGLEEGGVKNLLALMYVNGY